MSGKIDISSELSRDLTLFQITMMGLGMMIGAGVFLGIGVFGIWTRWGVVDLYVEWGDRHIHGLVVCRTELGNSAGWRRI